MTKLMIEIEGARMHNLQSVDLEIPLAQVVAICGVSGSGKTSLAMDTLYAEGQRRYIESFSAQTRQFLEQLQKPEADKIKNIPPAIAVTRKTNGRGGRVTVGTTTEIVEYLRLLFAKLGKTYCPECQQQILKHSPDLILQQLKDRRYSDGTRYFISFTKELSESILQEQVIELKQLGYNRVVVGHQTKTIEELNPELLFSQQQTAIIDIVVDRLTIGKNDDSRILDSLETAQLEGKGSCSLFFQISDATDESSSKKRIIDGQNWVLKKYSQQLTCPVCSLTLPEQEPRLFSFNSPLGACACCEGFGVTAEYDSELIIPDPQKSLREGAIAPWGVTAYKPEQIRLQAYVQKNNISFDIPYYKLSVLEKSLVDEKIQNFFSTLEQKKQQTQLKSYLSRWKSDKICSECNGNRLKKLALATRLENKGYEGNESGGNIAELCQLPINKLYHYFQKYITKITKHEQAVAGPIIKQILDRLNYLIRVGVGYLTLDRTINSLSDGEGQRVSLTTALGSSFVNVLYVIDEPSSGLHPRDMEDLHKTIFDLRNRKNSVLVIEHQESFLRQADYLIELGPGAGSQGGKITFKGTPEGIAQKKGSPTGDYLAGRRGATPSGNRRTTNKGWIRIEGARGNNLKNIDVEFPLGVFCLVTGVSGSGKSTLVDHILYPALCRRKHKDGPKPFPHEEILGDGQIEDCIMIDQTPIGKSPRSNPITYLKAFDLIRALFAETIDAKTHNYSASHFSFNVDGGRCSACKGDGYQVIDMQFMSDIYLKCPDCNGTRYREAILDVTYRGLNISEVLELTVRDAFSFFRGQPRLQAKLKILLDVGLGYLQLGQPANTLSAGESQRLKLASYLAQAKRSRTLFILDEPTTGLHPADISQLLDCFEALIQTGHSLIVIEHNLHVMKMADYIIDLGPESADGGGEVVATGTPEEIAKSKNSLTGKYLAEVLARQPTWVEA